MKLFKATFNDKTGKLCTSKKWYIDFTFNGTRHKLSGYTDKQSTNDLASLVNELINNSGGTGLPIDLRKRADRLNNTTKQNLLNWGILDGAQAKSKPLKLHIDDYADNLIHKGKTANYAKLQKTRLLRAFGDAGFNYYRDIQASKLQLVISGLHRTVLKKVKKQLQPVELGAISEGTKHHFLQVSKSFCRWMQEDGRASHNPLEFIKHSKVTVTAYRAALEPEELRGLLSYCNGAGVNFGLTGTQRHVVYVIAAQTGFRASEIAALKVSDFDLDGLTVTLSGTHTKNKKDVEMPLRPDTAEELKTYFAGKMPNVQAFRLPSKYNMAEMLRKDIESAGIKIEGRGNVDFHGLRHTFGTHLAAAGVHPKTAQTLMRHSDINLTMSRYTHTLRGQESTAINNLPDITKAPESQKDTGTESK